MYGNGSYIGYDGVEYSGLIGLTPLALCENQTYDDSLGTLVTFTEATECTEYDGVLTFGDIVIDTSGRDDSDSYEEDNWYDSDDDYNDEDFGGD